MKISVLFSASAGFVIRDECAGLLRDLHLLGSTATVKEGVW